MEIGNVLIAAGFKLYSHIVAHRRSFNGNALL